MSNYESQQQRLNVSPLSLGTWRIALRNLMEDKGRIVQGTVQKPRQYPAHYKGLYLCSRQILGRWGEAGNKGPQAVMQPVALSAASRPGCLGQAYVSVTQKEFAWMNCLIDLSRHQLPVSHNLHIFFSSQLHSLPFSMRIGSCPVAHLWMWFLSWPFLYKR